MKRYIMLLIILAGLSVVQAAYSPHDQSVPKITLTSPVFVDGGHIPLQFTGYGENKCPIFSWSGVPQSPIVKSFVITCCDESAGNFVHGGFFNIPGQKSEFSEPTANAIANLPGGIKQCMNSFGKNTWEGPKPPTTGPLSGFPHRYVFTIYALDTTLNLEAGVSMNNLLKAMTRHVVAKGVIVGIFQKP